MTHGSDEPHNPRPDTYAPGAEQRLVFKQPQPGEATRGSTVEHKGIEAADAPLPVTGPETGDGPRDIRDDEPWAAPMPMMFMDSMGSAGYAHHVMLLDEAPEVALPLKSTRADTPQATDVTPVAYVADEVSDANVVSAQPTAAPVPVQKTSAPSPPKPGLAEQVPPGPMLPPAGTVPSRTTPIAPAPSAPAHVHVGPPATTYVPPAVSAVPSHPLQQPGPISAQPGGQPVIQSPAQHPASTHQAHPLQPPTNVQHAAPPQPPAPAVSGPPARPLAPPMGLTATTGAHPILQPNTVPTAPTARQQVIGAPAATPPGPPPVGRRIKPTPSKPTIVAVDAKGRRPLFKDRQPAIELELREIAGHLTFTRNDVTAWYRLPEIQWAFRADKERTAVIMSIAAQFAALAGFRLHLRRTTRPYPADDWAARIDNMTPAPLPDVPGATSWAEHLVAAQHRIHQTNLAEGEVFLGVVFQRRTAREQFIELFNTLRREGAGQAERARLAQLVSRFDEVLGAFGLGARPASSREIEWLVHRSVALGMPAPRNLSFESTQDWEPGDILALTEHTQRFRSRYGATTKLVSLVGDKHVERHVSVLTFGRMEELVIPEQHEPWLHFHEQLPWSMELSSRMDVLGPGDALKSLEHKLLTIRSQQRDYFEHEMDPPQELERLAQRALDISDEMATGMDLDAARVHGWHRIAVAGRTEEECLARARMVADHYRSMRITLQHPKDQNRLLDEFIPGQPVADTGYLRRMPAKYFAAAVPQATAAVGDGRGPIIGETCGTSRRPVMWDPHFATEVRERSGLAVLVAEPGGGKSTLMGGIAYLAARRGIPVTILDPSGPLARLCDLPELKPYAREYNLTRGEPGTLAPYSLIPTPVADHYASEAEWQSAIAAARAERKALATDICTMLLPPQVAKERSTPILLQRAARQVEPNETATLDDVVRAVREFGTEGQELAETLGDVRDMPLSRLFFGRAPDRTSEDDATLTVITMAGLALPDLTIEREYWQLEERMALPMLHLATAFTTRRAYGLAMTERKLIGLDETHFLAGWGSGRALFTRLARDSRKWNIAAVAASQNPIDILGLDVQNLVSTVFVGRIAEDPEIADQALRMLGVERNVGYENTVAQLSVAEASAEDRLGYREFIMRDVDGRVQKFRVDLTYVPGLLGRLDTTARQRTKHDHHPSGLSHSDVSVGE